MRNPLQIKKSMSGKGESSGFPIGEISGYSETWTIKFMLERLDDLPKDSSVFFIGRYSFDVEVLKENEYLTCKFNNVNQLVNIEYSKRPDLRMCFLTAHKSKGLQADYVFIINNRGGIKGFPSKIQDAAILELLLDNCDSYSCAEERRLFYVALTRAKKKVFLLTSENQESEFVKELRYRYGKALQQERYTCPRCGGRLVRRNGKYGEFLGCSNYSKGNCNYTRNIK